MATIRNPQSTIRNPIITLTTDFGQADGYVGTMRGVILGILPGATVVDISHEIAPQDVAGGAFVLGRAYPFFPPGTVHCAVVDPGVGSARRAVLLRTARGDFVGPDNGLFSAVLAAEPDGQAFELTNATYWLPTISTTFHGRDIFAPVAAHRAAGVPPDTLGRPVPLDSLVRLPAPAPTRSPGAIAGHIVYIDRYGNALTDIPAAWVAALGPGAALAVRVGALRLQGVHTTYAAGTHGAPLALVGSAGLLEIAVRNGDAARQLGLHVGDAVECRAPAAP